MATLASSGPRTWSCEPTGGGGAEPRSDVGGGQRVEDEVRAREIARRLRLVTPEHRGVGAGHDQRPLGEAARMQDAEGAARGALGLEVRQLLDRDPQLLAERLLGPRGVAGDAVQRRALPGEVVEQLLVHAQLL